MAGGPLISRRRRRTVLALLTWGAWACAAPSAVSTPTQPAAAEQPAPPHPTPVSYTTPHPRALATPLDGTYAKLISDWPQWWMCRRCADYRPAGGIWRLEFDRSVMRIGYAVTGWHSLASFTVENDTLTLFNDPYCPEAVGRYAWQGSQDGLHLDALDDPCAFGLRAENLAAQPWHTCVGGIGLPEECAPPPDPSAGAPPLPVGIVVSVQGGHYRFMAAPPETVTPANPEEIPPPAGIRIRFSTRSIAYGLNRILWWEGNWLEVSTDRPIAAVGVQFSGAPQNGWARLLLDGDEVWRGNTADLGYAHGQYGGYVEVSGLGPGQHTLRVEALRSEYRPVSVAGFGFR